MSGPLVNVPANIKARLFGCYQGTKAGAAGVQATQDLIENSVGRGMGDQDRIGIHVGTQRLQEPLLRKGDPGKKGDREGSAHAYDGNAFYRSGHQMHGVHIRSIGKQIVEMGRVPVASNQQDVDREVAQLIENGDRRGFSNDVSGQHEHIGSVGRDIGDDLGQYLWSTVKIGGSVYSHFVFICSAGR